MTDGDTLIIVPRYAPWMILSCGHAAGRPAEVPQPALGYCWTCRQYRYAR